MDQNFRKRLQKTMYSGELEPEHYPLALTDLAVDYFQDLAPNNSKLGRVDLHTASIVASQSTVSPASMTMSMVYAKRLRQKRPDYVRNMSSSDLFIISMMMASKYLYDEGVDEEVFNDEWAENASLEKAEVNAMEMDFLDAMNWELFISKDDFQQTMLAMEKSIALKEGLRRGWFSYTDLCVLLDDPRLLISMSDMTLEWCKVVVVSSAAYVAALLAMVGSTVLVTSASVALTSTGLLLPSLLSSHLSAPSMHHGIRYPQSALPLAKEASALLPGLQGNSSVDLEEGLEAMEPPTEPPLEAGNTAGSETGEKVESKRWLDTWLPGATVVEAVVSQLVAVLTLKSHLLQFATAVTDNYSTSSPRNRGRHSTRKQPGGSPGSCHDTASDRDVVADDEEADSATAMMHRWLGMEESSADVDAAECCPRCRRKNYSWGSSDYSRSACWVPARQGKGQETKRAQCGMNCGRGHGNSPPGGSQCGWQSSGCGGGEGRGGQCVCDGGGGPGWKDVLLHTSVAFPDLTIGFATSMLPTVYAT